MYRIPKGTSAAETKIAARFPGRGQFPRGCQTDPTEAMKWLRKIPEKDSWCSIAKDAQKGIADRLIDGRDCPADPVGAANLLRPFAEKGYQVAKVLLLLYEGQVA